MSQMRYAYVVVALAGMAGCGSETTPEGAEAESGGIVATLGDEEAGEATSDASSATSGSADDRGTDTSGGDEPTSTSDSMGTSSTDDGSDEQTDGNDSSMVSAGGEGSTGDMSGSGGASLEVCDGIDNDNNGIIDDVDDGNDGICDCVRIATLGSPGRWGEGDIFATWLSERSATGAVALADMEITAELLEPHQVIVIQDVSAGEIGRTYTQDEIDVLQDWVEAGGGLMTLIGYADASEITNVNDLLAAFAVGYDSQQILPRGGGPTVPVTEWFTHPVSEGIAAIGVDNGYPVVGTGTVFATENGFDVGIATEAADGRVAMWGDEWITYDSEWQGMPNPDVEYQVELFWLNTIKWLTPPTECQVEIPVPQ